MGRRLATGMLMAFVWGPYASADDLRVIQNPWYTDTAFHESYIEKYGYSPSFQSISPEEELVDFITKNTNYDVARVCASSLNVLTSKNLLKPWDTSRIKDFDKIDPRFLFPDAAGNIYLIPFEFGSSVVVYNPESVPRQDTASLSIFHNPAYENQLGLHADIASIAAISFLAVGVTDWTKATDEETEAALQWWRDAQPNIGYYWSDEDPLIQEMAYGRIGLSYAFQEVATLLQDYGQKTATVTATSEGGSIWSCGLVMSADSTANPEHIYDYVNDHFSEAAIRLLHDWKVTSTNVEAAAEFLKTDSDNILGMPPADAPVLNQSPMPLAVRDKFLAEKKRMSLMP